MRSIIVTLILSALSLRRSSLLDKRDTAEVHVVGDIVWARSNHQEDDRASDGGVFAYGDSNAHGSMGSDQFHSPSSQEGTSMRRESKLDDRNDAVETNLRKGFITVDVIPEDPDQDQTPAFDPRRRSEGNSCLTCAKRDTGTATVEAENQTPAFDVRSVRNSFVSFVRDTNESIHNTGSGHDDVFVHWSRQSTEHDPVEAQGFDCSGRKRNPEVDSEDDTILWTSSSQHDWAKRTSTRRKRWKERMLKPLRIILMRISFGTANRLSQAESTEQGKRDSEPNDETVTWERRDVER
ncbi:uncharacterized protein L199_000130 [Kwoniella botswanensis]|uniref:uncharacterized protein n=1 Tax=Kwoniella botswanensis TaxID=1268659 RepID=UPI00315D1E8A